MFLKFDQQIQTLTKSEHETLSDDKDRLQKLKSKILKQVKAARAKKEEFDVFKWLKAETSDIPSKTSNTVQKKDRSTLKKCITHKERKNYVNRLMEEGGDYTDEEDEEYDAYLKRNREVSKKNKAAEKKAISSALHFRKKSMASQIDAEAQDWSGQMGKPETHRAMSSSRPTKRKASLLVVESSDDDEGEVPFVGEDLANSSGMDHIIIKIFERGATQAKAADHDQSSKTHRIAEYNVELV